MWALPDEEARRLALEQALAESTADEQTALVKVLKGQADDYLRSDIQRCLQAARLIECVANVSGDRAHRALGLLAEANARGIGLSEYPKAIALYAEAEQIYGDLECTVEQAQAAVGKLWPLTMLGRHDEAIALGRRVADVLEAAEQWLPLGKLLSNMGVIYGRLNEDHSALEMFDRARDIYRRLDDAGQPYAVRVEANRALILRNLGRFEESIAASEASLALVGDEQPIDRARAKWTLAITYLVLGKYNEALQLFEKVRAVHLDDGREVDALLVELFMSDCLLQLRRFRDVLSTCARVRRVFRDLGTRLEVAQAVLNEAVAYAGLEQFEEAERSIQEARELFEGEEHEVWLALTDLERATIALHRRHFEDARALAGECVAVFREHALSVPEAQARLVAARACSELGQWEEAHEQVDVSLEVGETRGVPLLIYQAQYLLGQLADQNKDAQGAMQYYDAAIGALERLRGRMMVEFRADFLEDKGVVYEDMVQLCVETDRVAQGLEYAERAKSRALLDMLAYRLDITVQARREEDEPLVAELVHLQAERDRLYRRWESDKGEPEPERGFATANEGWQEAHQEVMQIEQQITELWHRLLIRNADYARDAGLWQVRTEPAQPYLDECTLLVEYYVARGELLVFVVNKTEIVVRRLPDALGPVQKLSQLLWLNLRSAPRAGESRVVALAQNARAILQKLYGLLVAPLEDDLAGWERLIIVPHGPLHYLPFQALYDGDEYLLQRYEIGYLPGASFLRYAHDAAQELARQEKTAATTVAIGHSQRAQLPYTIQEARGVARLWQGETLLESEATLPVLKELASEVNVLHVAAHGDFRPDNPLFSGIALDDGWLTTLDIFNLRLQASLVTLSACQTGRNVVAGGDELLGLMRAFLYAGAASLVLSLWTVEDRSTAQLMASFYEYLLQGKGKAAALRAAQNDFIADAGNGPRSHLYYWAPFFLVGDMGRL